MAEAPTRSRELTPRWKLVERKVVDRELADDFDAEIAPEVSAFIEQLRADGLPLPDAKRVIDRIRLVLRHVGEKDQKVVLVSKPEPPYFGVTTKLAATVKREEPA